MAQKDKPWYENALLIAIAGSIIVVIGQLAGTVIPIMWGPEDISDFSIKLDHTYSLVEAQTPGNTTMKDTGPVNITIEDLHPILRPYKFNVNIQAFGNAGINIKSQNLKPLYLTQEAKSGNTLYVGILTNITKPGYYPIIFQGTGSGERKRNATFYLWVVSNEDYQKRSKDLKLPLIQIVNKS